MTPAYKAFVKLHEAAEIANNHEDMSGREMNLVFFMDPGRGDLYFRDPISGDRVILQANGSVSFGKVKVEWEHTDPIAEDYIATGKLPGE